MKVVICRDGDTRNTDETPMGEKKELKGSLSAMPKCLQKPRTGKMSDEKRRTWCGRRDRKKILGKTHRSKM